MRHNDDDGDCRGDTNGDGDSTVPAAGDWRWVYVDGGEALFDHAVLRYGGGASAGVVNATVPISESRSGNSATGVWASCIVRERKRSAAMLL